MDRRQQKTKQAIFKAFNKLLRNNNYVKITIQDIIDEANIGRSTFYSHFETKDDLLKAMCQDMFNHVFNEHDRKEKSHDFSLSCDSLEEYISHILCHIKDDEDNMKGLLSSDSSDIFFSYIKVEFNDWITKNITLSVTSNDNFFYNQISSGFIDAIKWWINNNCKLKTNELSSLYLNSIKSLIK